MFKKIRKMLAMCLAISMMMSLLSVTAFASVTETTPNEDGTVTETTTTTDENGTPTLVVSVTKDGDKVLSTETTKTETSVTEGENGEEITTETVTNTTTDYTGETELTDMPEVSAGLQEGETTEGDASHVDAEVTYEEDEDGNMLEMTIESTTAERELEVTTGEIVTEENKVLEGEEVAEEEPVHGELITDMTDAEGNVITKEEIAEAEQDADLDALRDIVTHGSMEVPDAEALEALKADLKEAGIEGIDELTADEVAAATQAALLAAANGETAEYEGSDAAKLFYDYLLNKEKTEKETIQVVEGSMSLTIGDKIGEKETTVTENGETITKTENDIYNAALNFQLTVVPTKDDDLLVCLQYTDADGVLQTVTKRLAGENSEDQAYETISADENGNYTIGGLKLSENEDIYFDLKLEGLQNLEDGLFVYGTEGEDGQTVKQVGTGNTKREINVTTSVSFKFDMTKDSKTFEVETYEMMVDSVFIPGEIARDKTATDLDSKDMSQINLTVGGAASSSVDVVFILGGGMQANRETIDSALNVFKPILEKTGKDAPTVKMGILSLEKGQEIILDLADEDAVLEPDTYEQLITDKFAYMSTLPGGSTNLHSQLVEAKKMLNADDEVKDENKYVFVIATGRTYWFDDANGEQATIVNKVNGTYYYADYLWRSQRGRHTSLYMIPDRYNDSYEAFFADIAQWVAEDGDKYVFTPHFDKNDYSAYEDWYNNNNKDLRALGVAGSRYGLGIVNPVPTAENFVNGQMNAIGSETHPLHALNYERAHYESAMAYKALLEEGYNCYAICSENPNYQNGSEYIKQGAKYTGTSTTQLGHSFMNFLAKMGGQTEAPTVWDYERDENGNLLSTNQVLQEDFFAPIAATITQRVSAGTRVEDYMGYDAERDYNFDFVQDAKTISMTVGGVAYTTAKLAKEEITEGATASYTFTAPGAEEPTFWLDYYYGDGKASEMFIWTFGEDVLGSAPASLIYKVKLMNKQTEPGTYANLYTNQSAVLFPVDSDGNAGEPLDFPRPAVEYKVVAPTDKGGDGEDKDHIVIPDSPVPLNPTPIIPTEEILEEEVPLADVPKTGDISSLWLALSTLSGAGLILTGKKRREDV